jgi:hypothetical protein
MDSQAYREQKSIDLFDERILHADTHLKHSSAMLEAAAIGICHQALCLGGTG